MRGLASDLYFLETDRICRRCAWMTHSVDLAECWCIAITQIVVVRILCCRFVFGAILMYSAQIVSLCAQHVVKFSANAVSGNLQQLGKRTFSDPLKQKILISIQLCLLPTSCLVPWTQIDNSPLPLRQRRCLSAWSFGGLSSVAQAST